MERNLTIDRSDLADTAQPVELASLVIKQVAPQLATLLPLPIDLVAQACGIREVHYSVTDDYQGCLIQDAHKENGIILLKDGMGEPRRRFTVAHELGHFVNLRHVTPAGVDRLLCSKEDMRAQNSGLGRHGMEAQANEFASCLLMPKSSLAGQPFMKASPEIQKILDLQDLCGVSKEAAARRYAELHGGDFAVVFSRHGVLRYAIRAGDFPWLGLKSGQELDRKSLARTFDGREGEVSEQEDSDGYWWLDGRDARRWELWEEVLVQRDGFRMTLLLGEQVAED